MDAYLLLKWVHILSATVLFGTGLGTAAHLWMTHRSGSVPAIAAATANTVRADWWFTLTSGLVQPASGAALIWLGGHDPFAPWLSVAYALYAIAGSCWALVVALQIRARDLAQEADASGQPLPRAYFIAMRAWYGLGWPAFLALLAVFWLMVAKPGG
ncbi:MAG: hypothetical protein K0S81_1681 [Rhodospirillales bacterium]|jgi:uncharacterized membrane protein|nr:hypothetical protein [Rhodospirillales bacterium]